MRVNSWYLANACAREIRAELHSHSMHADFFPPYHIHADFFLSYHMHGVPTFFTAQYIHYYKKVTCRGAGALLWCHRSVHREGAS